MQKLLRLCKIHWAALVIALLASAYVVLPGIVGYVAAGSSFDGIYSSNNGDWMYYASRVRSISEGHSGGNQYFIEHADDINVNAPGAEIALALIVRIFHIDAIHLLLALNVLMPFLATLILYALLYRLSRSRFISAAIPPFLILTNIWNLSKAVHPQVNLPMLLLLIFVWIGMLSRLDRRDPSIPATTALRGMWKSILLCGVLLGLLYFVYMYDWTYLFVVFGCSIILAFLFRQRDVAALNALIFGVSLPFGVWYATFLWRMFQSPLTADLAPRYGTYHTHLPETLPRALAALAAVLLIAGLLRYTKTYKHRVALGVFALVAANLIYPNYQIILGVVYETAAHWSLMPIIIFAIASAFVYPHFRHPPPEAARTTRLCALLFLILFAAASFRLARYLSPPVTEAATREFISVQRYGPILRYLQESTPKGSVVLTDDRLSYLIPAFTHNFVYYLNYSQYTPASNREIAERYLLSSQFNPSFFQDEDLGIGPRPKRMILWEAPYRIEETPLYRLLYGIRESPFSYENERAFVRETMGDLERSGGINAGRLKKYRLDYVIWDKKLHPDWTIADMPQIEQVFERNELIVYRVASS